MTNQLRKRKARKKNSALSAEAAKRATSAGLKAEVLKFIRIIFPVFACGLLIGYGLGRHWSPDYDNPAEIEAYVASQAWPASIEQLNQFDEQYNDDGQLTALTPKISELTFDCEITRYTSPMGKPFVSKQGISQRVHYTHRKPLDFLEATTLLYGSVEGLRLASQFPRLIGAAETLGVERRLKVYVAAAAAFVTGLSVGIMLGYQDTHDCTSDKFSAQLSDGTFWQSVQLDFRNFHSWFFTYDEFGVPRIDKSHGVGEFLLSTKRSDLLRMHDSRPDSFSSSDFMEHHFWLDDAIRAAGDNRIPNFWIRENQLIKFNPSVALRYEEQLWGWASHRGPVAARILVNKRFKGDVMVIVRAWRIDQADKITVWNFVSSPSSQDLNTFSDELRAQRVEVSPSATKLKSLKQLDMMF